MNTGEKVGLQAGGATSEAQQRVGSIQQPEEPIQAAGNGSNRARRCCRCEELCVCRRESSAWQQFMKQVVNPDRIRAERFGA